MNNKTVNTADATSDGVREADETMMSLPHETTKSPPLVKTDGGKTNIAVV
jgi:hypothetical protein